MLETIIGIAGLWILIGFFIEELFKNNA